MEHMHPDHPETMDMKSPTMGHAGHDHHAMMIADFKRRFYIVLMLTIPIMLLSETIQHWLNIHIKFPGSNILILILSSVVFFYGGWPFLKGWWDEMKTWKPGMMTLIGFAITVSYIYSVATVLGLEGMDFFWELATLILIMLLGHWIEMKSVAGASRELELLVKLMPDDAHLIQGDMIMDVKTETLKANDVVLIKPGEKVAADGMIIDGESYLNESLLTGESKPVDKKRGDKVIAGSINGNGAIKVSVLHGVKDSYLSQVIKLVHDAEQSKSKTQLLADTAARWLTLIALVTGATTFLVWYLSGKACHFPLKEWLRLLSFVALMHWAWLFLWW
jgi:Cu2+-exporting ATPase